MNETDAQHSVKLVCAYAQPANQSKGVTPKRSYRAPDRNTANDLTHAVRDSERLKHKSVCGKWMGDITNNPWPGRGKQCPKCRTLLAS